MGKVWIPLLPIDVLNISTTHFNKNISGIKLSSNIDMGGPRGVKVKAIDCGIVVSEFVFQSRYYVHFLANTVGKGMNPLILPSMG